MGTSSQIEDGRLVAIDGAVRRHCTLRQSDRRRFWTFATLQTLLLLCIVPFIHNGSIALPDEGVYSAQARALAHGSWSTPRPASNLIPDTPSGNIVFDPVGPSLLVGTDRIPYGRHPLYSIVLSQSYRLFGDIGLQLLSAMGVAIAATLTGLLAQGIFRRHGVAAMLCTSLGSSLLFSANLVAAQGLAVICSAGLILGVITGLKGKPSQAYFLVVSCAFILPMLRSEGALLIAAVVIGLVIVAIPKVGGQEGQLRSYISLAITTGLAGVAGWILDVRWTREILGSITTHYANPSEAIGGSHTSFVRAVWIGLLQPWFHAETASAALVFALGLIVVSLVIGRVLPKRSDLVLLLLALSAIAFIGALVTSNDLVTGLFATSPVLLFGVWSVFEIGAQTFEERLLLAISLLGVGFIGLTIYGDGGSTQWGGRFFQILIPPLVILSLAQFDRLADRLALSQVSRYVAVGSLAIGSLSIAILGLRTNVSLRNSAAIFTGDVRRAVTAIETPQNDSLVVYSPVPFRGSGRAFWRDDTDLNLVTVPFPLLREFVSEMVVLNDVHVTVLTDAPQPGVVSLGDDLEAGGQIQMDDLDVLPVAGLYSMSFFLRPVLERP